MSVEVDTQQRAQVWVAIAEAGRTQGCRTAANTPEGRLAAPQRAREQQQHIRYCGDAASAGVASTYR